jgi:hypothetical protein
VRTTIAVGAVGKISVTRRTPHDDHGRLWPGRLSLSRCTVWTLTALGLIWQKLKGLATVPAGSGTGHYLGHKGHLKLGVTHFDNVSIAEFQVAKGFPVDVGLIRIANTLHATPGGTDLKE